MNRKWLFLLIAGLLMGLTVLVTPRSVPAGQFDSLDITRWVVRAYFDDPQTVALLAQSREPWEVNYKENYLVIDANLAQWQELSDLGFRLEIDPTLTAELYRPRQPLPDQLAGIPGYPCYRTVEETYASAEQMVANYPTLATWSDVGDSWEKLTPGGNPGYDMMVLRLTNSAITGPKPKLFIMAAIHAREYTTAELSTRFAEFLLTNYGTDPDATWILDYNEVHLLLQSNPDGRKQAETGLSWRKNTDNNYCANTNSRGADLNRNFQFQWGCCGGSSSSQCSETYRGSSPASEPETQAVQNYVFAQFPDQRPPDLTAPAPVTATGVFLDIHSYSQLVLWPWGFTSTPAGNGTALQTLGRKFAYFNGYYPEQAIGLYPTDGTTDDFAYGELGLAAYTFELGTSFFQACSTFESTILPDNLTALLFAAKISRTPYLTPAGPDSLNPALDNAAVTAGTPVELTATANDTRFNNQNGTEPIQTIAAANYYINIPPWANGAIPQAMNASDGNFNSNIEGVTATVNTTNLTNGRHIIYVQSQDAAGNWGAVSAVFLYVIDPAVAPVMEGYVRDAETNQPLAATITIGNQFQTTTDPATGFYQTYVISGTYDLTATALNHASQTINGVVAQDFQTTQQDFSLTPVCTAFSDSVEGGNIGWTVQSPWTITTESSHSPSHSWADSPNGNYGDNRNVAITSPLIDLTDYTDVTLKFWQTCITEPGYDYCRVEISTNGGNSWTQVAAYDGSNSPWEEVSLTLPTLNNQANVKLRFRFTSDTGVTADGWHVDDIQLIGSGNCEAGVAPTAGFTSNSPVTLGQLINFSNNSTGTDLSFEWNFGDDSPINTTENPSHLYGAAGDYTVILTATNSLGSDSFSAFVTVETAVVAPTATFSSNSPVVLGNPVIFSNSSTGTDLTFYWDFGDGESSTEINPSHSYGAVGSYLVTLTATNSAGSDSYSLDVAVLAPTYQLYLPVMMHE